MYTKPTQDQLWDAQRRADYAEARLHRIWGMTADVALSVQRGEATDVAKLGEFLRRVADLASEAFP
jgi:hypothetical protein